MSVGDRGVHFVDPEDGGGLFHKPGTDADVDAGFDDVEDYDENAVVRRRKQLPTNWSMTERRRHQLCWNTTVLFFIYS